MKIFITYKEDCTGYGSTGGDHCKFEIGEVFLSEGVAVKKCLEWEEKERNEELKQMSDDYNGYADKEEREQVEGQVKEKYDESNEWGIKYDFVEREV